jgi:protein NEDD1
MVYDTTRPSSPGKKIPMSEAVQGEICAIACSPFSKSLVAVATLGGSVAMIDLDKEKGYDFTIIERSWCLYPRM